MSNLVVKPGDGSFTYADYCTWENEGESDTRWELIDGRAYAMAAPTLAHQDILGNLFLRFKVFLHGKTCKVYVAPCDVRLNHDKGDDTVVQPDLLVVCDPAKLADGKSVKGDPDWVIEILSPSTLRHDKKIKLKKYIQAGVKEVWFVDIDDRGIDVVLPGGNEPYAMYTCDERISVGILPELSIDLNDIFEPVSEQQEVK